MGQRFIFIWLSYIDTSSCSSDLCSDRYESLFMLSWLCKDAKREWDWPPGNVCCESLSYAETLIHQFGNLRSKCTSNLHHCEAYGGKGAGNTAVPWDVWLMVLEIFKVVDIVKASLLLLPGPRCLHWKLKHDCSLSFSLSIVFRLEIVLHSSSLQENTTLHFAGWWCKIKKKTNKTGRKTLMKTLMLLGEYEETQVSLKITKKIK